MSYILSEEVFMQYADHVAGALELPDSMMYGASNWTINLMKPIFGPFSNWFHQTSIDAAAMSQLPAETAIPNPYAVLNSFNEFLDSVRHPLVHRLPMVSLDCVLFSVLGYLIAITSLFVISKVIGKQSCKMLGIIHNFILFSVSLYMSVAILSTAAASFGYRVWDNTVGGTKGGPGNDWRLAKLMWIFYISKLPEFGDTFLMILKHNFHQVSFLHVYHHTSILCVWFVVITGAPGGDAYFTSFLNSTVHVVMYGYYLGTMVFPNERSRVRRFLNRFKFVITKGQMTQFVLNCCNSVYCLYILPETNGPRVLYQLMLGYMMTMLALFANFLFKNTRKNTRNNTRNNTKKGLGSAIIMPSLVK